jgi:glycerate dehydrogenase
MNIVILDGYTLNPGDLSWDSLRALGSCIIHDRTPATLTVERALEAEIVLTNKTILDRACLTHLPRLRYIGVLATGHNVVDVATACERGIVVTNVPEYGTRSVAQHTFALLLELTHHCGDHAAAVRAGQWTASPDFSFWNHPLVELDDLTLGLIGYGHIGRAVGEMARAFGMRVIVHSRSAPESVTLDTIFRESDVVSLHCPLTPETRELVNASRLALMKPTAVLLNTSRGLLVNEQDLANALNTGCLAGAGLDVLSTEPPPSTNPLLTAANCIVTPHLAWATHAARERLLRTAIGNIRAFLDGKPQNTVGKLQEQHNHTTGKLKKGKW